MSRRPIIETPRELYRRMYEGGCEPAAWHRSSDALLRAARVLLPVLKNDEQKIRETKVGDGIIFDCPMWHVYMLLVGFAVENLAKGICVARDPALIEEGRLGPTLKKHYLLDLVARADVTLSDDESELIERLEVFVMWAGRYPIPTNLKGFLPRENSEGGWGPLNYFQSSDVEQIEQLISRLEGVLDELSAKA